VIVDRLTKSAHFIPVKLTHRISDYDELYFSQIVKLHGVPRTIISDRGPQFTARFWEHLHSLLGTKLIRSSAYHPQTSGQTERVNQILEDMLRACVISSKGAWEKWLPLAEFSCNDSYQESIQMAPFEALYDRRRKPLEFEVGDFVYLKVSPMKGVNRFGVKRKLAPRYVGPYQII